MGKFAIYGETLTGIADAIREKTGETGLLSPIDMAAAIAGIQTGGGSGGSGGDSGIVAVAEKEVNFYDYDGTCLYAYTVAEAQALSELPAGPAHEGLVFQKWNWSLENVKALTRPMNIGALYTTNDDSTRIYIRLKEGYTSPMLGISTNGTVSVDWGDGTTPDEITGSGGLVWTPKHEYTSPGDYVITLNTDAIISIGGDQTGVSRLLRNSSSSSDGLNPIYLNSIKRIEMGSNASFSMCALRGCASLKTIAMSDKATYFAKTFMDCFELMYFTVPSSVTALETQAFSSCHSLAKIALPQSLKSLKTSVFDSCVSLEDLAIPESVSGIMGDSFVMSCVSLRKVNIPDGVTSIDMAAFASCYKLTSLTIPPSVTSLGYSLAMNCCGMEYYDFSEHTVVPTLMNDDAFMNIHPDCEIRVPAALYDEWIAAENWSMYTANIVAV